MDRGTTGNKDCRAAWAEFRVGAARACRVWPRRGVFRLIPVQPVKDNYLALKHNDLPLWFSFHYTNVGSGHSHVHLYTSFFCELLGIVVFTPKYVEVLSHSQYYL